MPPYVTLGGNRVINATTEATLRALTPDELEIELEHINKDLDEISRQMDLLHQEFKSTYSYRAEVVLALRSKRQGLTDSK